MNNFCPTKDFKKGISNGNCWGCGHYLCQKCKFLREDFKGNKGFEKRDNLLAMQNFIQIKIL
ncbi:MAG: hypothetical protein WC346_05690 [Methanogenium sp.]|jgi:hypothetical protein